MLLNELYNLQILLEKTGYKQMFSQDFISVLNKVDPTNGEAKLFNG